MYNDIHETLSRVHLYHYDTHVQSCYFERTPFNYHKMDTIYHNRHSMQNSLGSQYPNK